MISSQNLDMTTTETSQTLLNQNSDNSSVATSNNNGKQNFRAAPEWPTQNATLNSRFDFNDGCRVLLTQGKWQVRLTDMDTGNIVYETHIEGGSINSAKRYFIRFRIEVWESGNQILTHEYCANNQQVLIQFPIGTLGDTVGWLPYAIKFQQQHHCQLTCAIAEWLIPLFENAYPDIRFITHEQVKPEQFYATYRLGLFFDDDANIYQPCDFRLVGLHRTAGYILGVDPTEQPPRVVLADNSRPIAEPYVCIATQSTTQCKYWNNPNGWRDIILFLKENGYRVICIDQKPVHGGGIIWNHLPHGAEDETGNRPLMERARWLKHAEFFIGLSSGLSWLAWAMEIPVVMISGFTHPTNEFATPYRIINYHACNSCWNDNRLRFNHYDFLWCPRHANTQRQFECTRLITVDAVKTIIERLPSFIEKKCAV
ncbi:MAG: autotransporter strand-loop-strand O-heptosyltransferase [Methylococcaceae bacterium]